MGVGRETPAYYLQPLPVADSQEQREQQKLSGCNSSMVTRVVTMKVTWDDAPACFLLARFTTLSTCFSASATLETSFYLSTFLRTHVPRDPSTSTQAFADSKHTNLYKPSITQQAFTIYPLKAFFTFSLIRLWHTNAAHHTILFEGHYFAPSIITSTW